MLFGRGEGLVEGQVFVSCGLGLILGIPLKANLSSSMAKMMYLLVTSQKTSYCHLIRNDRSPSIVGQLSFRYVATRNRREAGRPLIWFVLFSLNKPSLNFMWLDRRLWVGNRISSKQGIFFLRSRAFRTLPPGDADAAQISPDKRSLGHPSTISPYHDYPPHELTIF